MCKTYTKQVANKRDKHLSVISLSVNVFYLIKDSYWEVEFKNGISL
jgi:hypothetical protein